MDFSFPFLLCACFAVDLPPQATLADLSSDGLLPDPQQPVAVRFDEPVVAASLRARIIKYETDPNGDLYDVGADPDKQLTVYFDGANGMGGAAELDAARQSYAITPSAQLPIGPPLAVLLDAGLADDEGDTWKVRQILKFAYQFKCADPKPTKFPAAGDYFFLVAVDKPVSGFQIKLFASIKVATDTGEMIGQFTRAARDASIDCAKFGLSCQDGQVCRTLPIPACVEPSEKAGTTDEYADFVPDVSSSFGFSFTLHGCIADQPDGSFALANLPGTFATKTPPVTTEGVRLNASWQRDAMGVLRGSGAFSADKVLLGGMDSGQGTGTHAERQIPDGFKSVPEPPPK